MKTVLAVHWVILTVWCLLQAAQHRPGYQRRSAVLRAVSACTLMPALLWTATFAYFALTGRLNPFVDAVFRFNLSYASSGESFLARFVKFFNPPERLQIFHGAWPLWLGAFLSVVILTAMEIQRNNPARLLLLLVLGAGYCAVCLPNQFWPHYYYLMIPPAAIALSAGIECLVEIFCGRSVRDAPEREVRAPLVAPSRLVVAAAHVVLAASVMVPLAIAQTRVYLSQDALGITDQRYQSREFWAKNLAEKVRDAIEPKDEIFIYGNDASIYYYSQRRCASRFTMIGALNSRYPGSEERRRIMVQEIRNRRPRLILVLLGEEAFPEWTEFLPTRYDDVGYDFRPTPPHDPILMLLCDRDRPIAEIDWESHLPR